MCKKIRLTNHSSRPAKSVAYRRFFYTWLLMTTIALSFVLGNKPDIFPFLNPPESLALWLIDLYGSSNGEELSDLELLYTFVCSFFIVFTVTLLFFRLKNVLTKRSRLFG